MRGVDNRRSWWLALAAALLLIIAGVKFLDYKTNQMLALASPDIVGILETETDPIAETGQPDLEIDNESDSVTGDEEEPESDTSPPVKAPVTGSPATSEAGGTPIQSAPASSKADIKEQDPVAQEVTVDTQAATLAEKAKAYKLASSKLSAKEINALIQWSQGGFTQEERESAKALFYSRFTAEEQQWILGLFRKYGQ